jgi:hypothetical protein
MIRQHDVHVIAQGTFRIVLTREHRVAALIYVDETELGPLKLLFEVVTARHLPPPLTFRTGGFDLGHVVSDIGHAVDHAAHDVGHAVEHAARDVGHVAAKAAEHTFNVASKAVTTLATPAFEVVKGAAAGGAHLLAQAPFIPEGERKKIEAASRVMMRARLGDIDAKTFVNSIANAAKQGAEAARHVGDALLTGQRMVAHVLDAPLSLAEKIPVVGGTIHGLSPFQTFEKMTTALQHGDFHEMKKIATDQARLVQGVASIVPGLGTGISAAIGTGLAILDGGGPLDIAIHAAYGAIPIPPGLREITDAVLDGVLALAHQGNLTDAVLAAARSKVPDGLPRQVFDTLAQLVVKRVPIQKAGEQLVSQYVQRYAPGVDTVADVAKHVADAAHVAEDFAHTPQHHGGGAIHAKASGVAHNLKFLPAASHAPAHWQSAPHSPAPPPGGQ